MEENYNVSCSQDRLGLRYPGFSVVFIQTFTLHHNLRFKGFDGPALQEMDREIERQIFILHEDKAEEKRNVRRFMLPEFQFTMPIVPAEDEQIEPLTLSGHCKVEMNLFFGHTVSLTYRFLFNGVAENACVLSAPAGTDHIIALLSTWLGAEFWSKSQEEEDGDSTDINYETEFLIDKIWIGADGKPLEEPEIMGKKAKGRYFDNIALRYKKFICNYCTELAPGLSREERLVSQRYLQQHPLTTENDSHYAMVDIWENVMHPMPDGSDLFSTTREPRLSEAQIVEHLREYHKSELIGLLTLYPEEWPYRDDAAYDEVCGPNIAIDTDDLVLVGSSVCVVIGTYGRRGSGEEGVNWVEHLEERAHYHVSWPEYLIILQMILAKKHIIGRANDQLVEATLNAGETSAEDLIGHNAELSMRLSRMMLQLDVVKYSKFPAHKVMFDRTYARLGVEEDLQRLNQMMDTVDSSLHNLSDYKSMRSEFLLNIILALISVASTFELFFQTAEMPFLTYFGLESSRLAAVVVSVVACVTIFGLLLVLVSATRSIVGKIKNLIR